MFFVDKFLCYGLSTETHISTGLVYRWKYLFQGTRQRGFSMWDNSIEDRDVGVCHWRKSGPDIFHLWREYRRSLSSYEV